MRKSRLLHRSLLLAGVATFGLVASASAQNDRLAVFGPSSWDTFAPGAPEEVVQRVTKELNRRFMEAHPEITEISHDSRGNVADGLARLRNAQLAGDQVDVVVCAANPVNTSYARLGLIEPVDDLVADLGDVFTDGSVANFTVDGQVWGVPISAVNLTTFFYNKEVFDAAGLEEPATYEAFLEAVPALQEMDIIPIVHQGKNAWMWPLYYMSALSQTTGNQQIEHVQAVLSGGAKFTDESSLKALQLTRGWVDDGLLDPQSNELDEDAMKSVFYSGRAAAYFGGSWDVPVVTANAPFEWGVFRFPKFADQPGTPVAYGGAESGLCVSSTAANPEMARAYIAFAAQSEQVELLLEPLSPLATSHTAMGGAEGSVAEDLRSYLPAAKFLDWVWPRELTSTIQSEIQSMMGGSISPEQAAENMQAKLDAMIAEGYGQN